MWTTQKDRPIMRGPRAKIAVAGLGRMGRVHAANLAYRCPSAHLVAVFDAQQAIAAAVAGQLGVPAAPTYDDLLADGAIDAVVIAVPTGAHASLALRAGRAHKHVFCEKPLSLDRDETVAVVEELAAEGVGLQVGFHRRFDPASVAAAGRAQAGELGDLYLFRASQRDMSPPKTEFLAGSGGIFVDMGIHDFDFARWLVGEITLVSALGAAVPGSDTLAAGDFDGAVVAMEFASGALGLMDISRVAGYGYESSVEIMGSKATVRIDDPFLHHYQWRASGSTSQPLVTSFDQRYENAFVAELEAFAGAVAAGASPAVTGWDALAAFDLAQAAQESCRLGQPVKMVTPQDPSRAA